MQVYQRSYSASLNSTLTEVKVVATDFAPSLVPAVGYRMYHPYSEQIDLIDFFANKHVRKDSIIYMGLNLETPDKLIQNPNSWVRVGLCIGADNEGRGWISYVAPYFAEKYSGWENIRVYSYDEFVAIYTEMVAGKFYPEPTHK